MCKTQIDQLEKIRKTSIQPSVKDAQGETLEQNSILFQSSSKGNKYL